MSKSVTIDELDRFATLTGQARRDWWAEHGQDVIEQAKSERLLRRDFEALDRQFQELRQLRAKK